SEADVERLLQSFWTRMQGSEEKAAALALFELEGAVDYPAIKLRYRQLVSQHHPDRGGSTARLQSINKAMEILQRYYSRP
ncbi:J domain-containing protein, partial [Pseudomonas aeruginosa]